MGVTRVDDLPANIVQSRIIEAKQVSRERKAPQQMAGSNLRYFTSESGSTFEWSGRLDGVTGSPSYGIAAFDITFTSDYARVPMVDAALTVFSSTDGVNWSPYSNAQSVSDNWTVTAPELIFNVLVNPGALNGDYQSKWHVFISGRFNAWAAFKLQAIGIDVVTISAPTRVL